MYGKIIDGALQYAPLNLILNEQVILNFNKNINLMMQYGYKQIIDEKPLYDDSTQELKIIDFDENDNDITIVYEIINKEEQTLEDRITNLENQITTQSSILSEEINK